MQITQQRSKLNLFQINTKDLSFKVIKEIVPSILSRFVDSRILDTISISLDEGYSDDHSYSTTLYDALASNWNIAIHYKQISYECAIDLCKCSSDDYYFERRVLTAILHEAFKVQAALIGGWNEKSNDSLYDKALFISSNTDAYLRD